MSGRTRAVTLRANAPVELDGGLTLKPGNYAAIEFRPALLALSDRLLGPPKYTIELAEKLFAESGGKPGPDFISETFDLTKQVREGLLKIGRKGR